MNRRSFFARAFGFGAAVCMTHFLPIEMPKWKWGPAFCVVTSSGFQWNPSLTEAEKLKYIRAFKKPMPEALADIWEDREQKDYTDGKKIV